MSSRGNWGDKTIITLHSTDARRNKNWCEHYRKSDKFCCETVSKCIGSSHCPYYKQKSDLGPVEQQYIPAFVPIVTLDEPYEVPKSPIIKTFLPGYNPPFGEKLFGKVVLIKGRLGRITIGEVIAENHDFITVEKDDGSISKYCRRTVVSTKSFWVLE